jgi:hypothetical protein
MRRSIRRKLEGLSDEEVQLLLDLLESRAALLTIEGSTYAVSFADGAARVHGPETYTVSGGACTCPDSRYRSRVCKHVQALRALGLV